MKDHGELDEFEQAQVLGELLETMRQRLEFAPVCTAKTDFVIDDVVYEVTLKRVSA